MKRAQIRAAAIAACALAAAPLPASAQLPVNKPAATSTGRLPLPSPVVASQRPDGTIDVRWRSIPGAAKYQVTRSVPPTGAQVVANPTDTVYVDANVQAGSYYYYVVGAVDSAGIVGLKAGSAPVASTMTATTSGGGTTTSPSGGTSTTAFVAPTAVMVDRTPTPWLVIYFSFTQSGMSYRVERAIVTSGSKTAPTWQLRQTTGPRPCCFSSVVDTAYVVSQGESVVYRVSTVDPAGSGRTSAPTVSPPVTPTVSLRYVISQNSFQLPPTIIGDRTATVNTLIGSPKYAMTLDPSVVGPDASGAYVAKAPGVTYLIWATIGSAGDPIIKVERITVVP